MHLLSVVAKSVRTLQSPRLKFDCLKPNVWFLWHCCLTSNFSVVNHQMSAPSLCSIPSMRVHSPSMIIHISLWDACLSLLLSYPPPAIQPHHASSAPHMPHCSMAGRIRRPRGDVTCGHLPGATLVLPQTNAVGAYSTTL